MKRKIYTGIEQFDFQIIRFTSSLETNYTQVSQDLKEIGQAISDFESWYIWWSEKAKKYEADEIFEVAATYYRAALFYLAIDDSRLIPMHKKFVNCFNKFYENSNMERFKVPYKKGYLPAILMKKKEAKRTLLVFGGFDSYLEELAGWFFKLYQEDFPYNILIFDGPGQGYVPMQGLFLPADFELPVSTILDYFNLKEVDAVGISLGGYLVMRAAAFEKRIKRIVVFDIFYDSLDAVGWFIKKILNWLLKHQYKTLTNRILEKKASKDVDLQWTFINGYRISGKRTPFDFFNYFRKFQVKSLLPLINQPCLLLAGKDDFYVPAKRLKTIEKALINSMYVETKLFTEETGGNLHCQVDNMNVAIKAIKDFLMKE